MQDEIDLLNNESNRDNWFYEENKQICIDILNADADPWNLTHSRDWKTFKSLFKKCYKNEKYFKLAMQMCTSLEEYIENEKYYNKDRS